MCSLSHRGTNGAFKSAREVRAPPGGVGFVLHTAPGSQPWIILAFQCPSHNMMSIIRRQWGGADAVAAIVRKHEVICISPVTYAHTKFEHLVTDVRKFERQQRIMCRPLFDAGLTV